MAENTPSNTPAEPVQNDGPSRRRVSPKQALVRVRQRLETLKKQESELAVKAAKQDRAVLARQGRMVFLHAVEEMHQGERDLQVRAVLEKLEIDKRAPVEAWLASLAD